jgi:formate hydrogenlyase subunit 6/NADH:ubiquinone oxidoreductase subunit I
VGRESGVGTYLEEDIELVGDDVRLFRAEDFVVERSSVKPYRMKGVTRFVSNRLVSKPFITDEKCVRCGICVTMCPVNPKAVNWFSDDKSRPPTHNYRDCIRCYCCQEVCPEGAIELRVPVARRLFNRMSG